MHGLLTHHCIHRSCRRSLLLVLGLALAVFTQSSPGAAQAPTTASISGFVYSSDGSPLPGVTVLLTDAARAVSTTRISDQNGYFVFPTVSPGTYSLTTSLEGLQQVVHENIVAGSNAKLRFEFRMGPPVAVQETVTVSAHTPSIETTEPAIKSTIAYEQFDNLPVLSRNFQEVVDTLPSVTKTGANFNIAGSRDNQNIFLIDGARNNDLTGTSSRFGQSVYFIVAQQNPDDPTVGLQTGYNLQTYNLDAISEIQVVTSAYSAEYGQGSGGVINLVTRAGTDNLKAGVTLNFQDESLSSDDSFDELNRRQGSFSLGGPFSRSKSWYFASYERDEYEVGFDQRRIAYPGQPTGGKIRSFVLGTDLLQSDTTQDRFASKVSFQISDENLLNATVNWNDEGSLFNSAINRPSLDQVEPRHGKNDSLSGLLNDDKTFGDNSILNSLARYGHTNRKSTSDLGVDGEQPLIYTVGPGGPSDAIFTDFYVLGAFGELIDATLDVFEWKEAYTWFHGSSHAPKIGFDWERFKEDLAVPARELFVSENIDPAGNVVPVTTVPPPPSSLFTFFSTGTPIDQQTAIDLNTYSIFALDDWNITPRWTLSYGLRYDRDDFLDNNEFSPRIHTIYSITPRLVLRAGAGIFRDRSTLLGTEEETVVRSRGIGYDKATELPTSDPTVLPPKNVFLVDNFKSPVTDQANAGLEYDLGNGYVVGGNFIYKDFDHLVWTEIINEPALSGAPTDPSLPVSSKLIGDFGVMKDELVELVFRKRFNNGAYFNFNYTHEHTNGNASQELAGRNETVIDNFAEAQDQLSLRHSADYEIEDALKLSGVYFLPWGFQVSTVAKYRTGRPWTVEQRVATPFAHFIAPEGINSRNLPDEFQWDLHAAKSFNLSGRHLIEVYLDGFNITNHDNVRSVQQIITTANFAQPTSFNLPRTLQVGVKYRL